MKKICALVLTVIALTAAVCAATVTAAFAEKFSDDKYPESSHYPVVLEDSVVTFFSVYEYSYTGDADCLKVKFSDKTRVGAGDRISIYKGTYESYTYADFIGSYENDSLAGKEIVVYGKEFVIEIHSESTTSYCYGFSVDSITPLATHTVTFKNYDGTYLSQSTVIDGEKAVYNGEKPTKEKNGNISYVFDGWDIDLDNITEDKVATAVFREKKIYFESEHNIEKNVIKKYTYTHPMPANALSITFDEETTLFSGRGLKIYDADGSLINKYSNCSLADVSVKIPGNVFTIEYTASYWYPDNYGFAVTDITPLNSAVHTVTFKDFDGTVLESKKAVDGDGVIYTGYEPNREPDDYEYTFTGWDGELASITADTVFTAQYDATVRHTVVFKNYDGTVLDTQRVTDGKGTYFNGSYCYENYGSFSPVRMKDNNYVYKFAGWDKDFKNVTCDLVVTAQFDACKFHKVTYNNYDGTVIGEEYVADGRGAELNFRNCAPERPRDSKYIYVFSNTWDKDLTAVTEDMTVTAVFDSYEYYTVKYLNYDGTALYEDYVIKERGNSQYGGSIPFKPADGEIGYIFSGKWSDGSYSWRQVTGDMNITALFDEVPVVHIRTEEELKAALAYSEDDSDLNRYAVLENDITLSEKWTPVVKFSGILLGQNHTISNVSLTDDAEDYDTIGFLRYVDGAVIRDLSLEINYTVDRARAGGFVGVAENSVISNCHTYGSIKTTSVTFNNVYSQSAGFAGAVRYDTYVEKCSSDVDIYSDNLASGFVGWIEGGYITDSFCTGSITVNNKYGSYSLYGFTGQTWSQSGTVVKNSYSSVKTKVTDSGVYEPIPDGADIGFSEVTPFSPLREVDYVKDGTQFVYIKNNDLNNCYYNSDLFGLTASVETEAAPLTDEQMKTKQAFKGFDFEGIWSIDENVGYPYIVRKKKAYTQTNFTVSESGTAVFDVKPVNVPLGSKVVLVCYKGGKVADVQIKDNSGDALTFDVSKEFDSVKVIALKSFADFCPLTKAENLQKIK